MHRGVTAAPWVLGGRRWVLHGVFWLGWATVLAIFFFDVALGHIQGWGEFSIYMTMHIGTFYIVAYGVGPAIFKHRNRMWWRLLLYPVALLVGVAALLIALSVLLGGLTINGSPGRLFRIMVSNFWPVVLPFVPSVVTGLLCYGLRWGVMQQVALRHVQQYSDGLSRSLASSRQSELFTRILPHLLFNLLPILHRIVVLNYKRFDAAFDRIADLLKFFARLPPGVRIAAWEELRQVHALISLKELAIGRKIHVAWDLDERLYELTVFPMAIFVPVENALKYAIITRPDTPVVVRVKRSGGMVVVETQNRINPEATAEGHGLGMGLDNLREQLAILTDDDFSLAATEGDGRFGVTIQFPLSPRVDKGG